jgi:copper oxidase (laccase) domain-containing protein
MIHYGNRLVFKKLEEVSWLEHCFTTRRFQEESGLKLAGRLELSRRLKRDIFPAARALLWGEQVHGTGTAFVENTTAVFAEIVGVDALVCAVPGICIVAYSADCPIVYLVDLNNRAIGLVHSGRKGTEEKVVSVCLREMRDAVGTSSADCMALISPSIGPCCYPVDLWQGLERQLRACGVTAIFNPRMCTGCNEELFFSYRRERKRSGRMLAAMMLKTVSAPDNS